MPIEWVPILSAVLKGGATGGNAKVMEKQGQLVKIFVMLTAKKTMFSGS
jgi:hypothetical protein